MQHPFIAIPIKKNNVVWGKGVGARKRGIVNVDILETGLFLCTKIASNEFRSINIMYNFILCLVIEFSYDNSS